MGTHMYEKIENELVREVSTGCLGNEGFTMRARMLRNVVARMFV